MKTTELTIREGKSLSLNERVAVYYNLNKGGFSIKSLEGVHKGKVVAYAPTLKLLDAEFKVSPGTLKRIQTNKQKEVYAVVRGTYVGTEIDDVDTYSDVYINPYTCPYFTSNENIITKADEVIFLDKCCKTKGEK